MENDFRTASKRFWVIVNTVYGGEGALLTSTRDVVSRWGEYFEDLLNPFFFFLPLSCSALWQQNCNL